MCTMHDERKDQYEQRKVMFERDVWRDSTEFKSLIGTGMLFHNLEELV